MNGLMAYTYYAVRTNEYSKQLNHKGNLEDQIAGKLRGMASSR